ncbi:SRPBCC domain-containing protein [Streptomyces aureus]|uniref:SRPBCC domain-containing protein n=1 Tax=Streptomyces aureus TaxID=193461 RepID=UPI0033FA48E6
MEYGSIERELYVDAPPQVVFDVLTDPEYIREWWSAENDFEATPGRPGTLTWTNESSGVRKSVPFTVVESDPPRTLSFRWTHDEGETAAVGNSLLVTFDLTPEGEGTTLRFRETGYRERGWEAAVLEAHYNDHRQGWDFYLPRMAATAKRVAGAR